MEELQTNQKMNLLRSKLDIYLLRSKFIFCRVSTDRQLLRSKFLIINLKKFGGNNSVILFIKRKIVNTIMTGNRSPLSCLL